MFTKSPFIVLQFVPKSPILIIVILPAVSAGTTAAVHLFLVTILHRGDQFIQIERDVNARFGAGVLKQCGSPLTLVIKARPLSEPEFEDVRPQASPVGLVQNHAVSQRTTRARVSHNITLRHSVDQRSARESSRSAPRSTSRLNLKHQGFAG